MDVVFAICGIDDCREQYRVFNSLYYHIRRRHASYLANGCPPLECIPFRSGCLGGERFDIPIFAKCITPTSNQIEESTPSSVTTSEDASRNEGVSLQEDAFHGDEIAGTSNQDQVHDHEHVNEKVGTDIEGYKVQHVGFYCDAAQLV